jgi:hypothetical protein
MENKRKISIIFLILAFAFSAQATCKAQGLDLSQYLYEYALQLYQRGNFADASHELKKALMVNPNNCVAKELLLRISPPPQIIISTPFAYGKSFCPNREITFIADTLTYYGQQDFIYRWDFGDGTAVTAGPKVTHSYAQGGRYLVKLLREEERFSKCPCQEIVREIYVNSPPVADSGHNVVCCVNQEVVFDGSASSDADGDELSFFWDFGDGTTATDMVATHTYTRPGKYRVTLLVSDNSGSPCDSAQSSFTAVASTGPEAMMEVTLQE